jgi:hypothetical protein
MATATDAVNAGKNAVSGVLGFVRQHWGKVATLSAVCLVTAALVTAPGTAPGIAAFAGKSITPGVLPSGVVEGVVEGSGKIAEGASWVAAKLGGAAPVAGAGAAAPAPV